MYCSYVEKIFLISCKWYQQRKKKTTIYQNVIMIYCQDIMQPDVLGFKIEIAQQHV
jgi:hypothetical protein